MRTLFYAIVFTVVGILNNTLCFSQTGSISGKLTLEDGSPVAFATLHIPALKKHTLSDENGKYLLAEIPYGNHELEIASLEIQKGIHSVQINKPSQERTFVLKRAGDRELAEVLVQGASVKEEIEEMGFAVNVIETKRAALQSVQTNDLLNRSVGIKVRQNGGLGAAVVYNLNGMSGNSVRVFIDGIPLSTYGNSFSLNSIPPALIDRIEVYKGVIPAHLADDALGGAINVILKKSVGTNVTASLSYGSFNTQQANFNASYRDAKSGFTVKASGFYNYSDNDYEVWGKFVRNILPNGRYDYVRAKRFNDAYRSVGGLVEVGFTGVKWADRFLIGFNGSDDYKEIQHGTYMTIPYMGRFSESSSKVLSLSYSKADFMTKGLELTFSGMLSDRNQVVNDTVRWNYDWFGNLALGLDGQPTLSNRGAQQGAPTINHVNRNVGTFRGGFNYDVAKNHRVVLSHMYYQIDRTERDEMLPANVREFIGTRDLTKNVTALAYEFTGFDAKLKSNLFGKYYQQAIDRVDPKLENQNGEMVKVEDHVASNKHTTGYGWALSYMLNPKFTILTSAEKAVRMPSENEVFGSPGENIVENIHIRPEISNNLNVGFRAHVLDKGEHKLNLYTSAFLRNTKDKILQLVNSRNNDAVQTAPFVNMDKTQAIGFESEIGYIFKNNLNISVNVSKFNLVDNMRFDKNGNEYSDYKKQIPNEPFFTINSTVQYALNNLIQDNSVINLYYGFGFVDRFYTNWLMIEYFRTPRQFIQDLGVNYVFPNKKLVVSGDIRNIFDRQAYDNFAVQKPGRGFYLKINYTLNNF